MTSHTPQPQAGDDLVARLREGVVCLGSIEGDIETYDIDSANECMLEAASRIEALTSQQHTEPVAGEVEVVAWTTPHMLEAILEPFVICGTIWPEESADASVGLVTKSSYDALAAAKDATIADLTRERDEALGWAGDWHRQCQTVATILGLPEPDGETHAAAVRDKFDAVQRQRDALREALTDVRAFLTTHISVRRHEGDSYYSQTLARVEAALKDEGGAT